MGLFRTFARGGGGGGGWGRGSNGGKEEAKQVDARGRKRGKADICQESHETLQW